MKFRILGRFELVSDGEVRPVTRPLVRGALFALVLYRDQPLAPDRLIDLLWGPEGEMENRLHSLRSCMWNIRQVLTPDRLITDDAGYRLPIDPRRDEVDVDRFRDLHRQGRAAFSAGDAGTAARLLDEAMSQWEAGRLSELLPPTPALTSLIIGLDEEHRDARNTLIQARLALGEHQELLAELRTLITTEPTDEQLWADLMLALYRCGLKADALSVFTEARAALATHLGVEPGTPLRALRCRIQGDDPALQLSSVPTEALRQELAATPRQLPPDVADFTGRAAEAAELIALLSPLSGATAIRVAQISGPPGIGKSALAVRVAHAVVHDYPNGQLYLRLAGASTKPCRPGDVLDEALRSLGVAPSGIPEAVPQRSALFRTLLAGRRVLIVIDDAASPDQIEPLLPGMAGCAVIITSRIQLVGVAAGRSMSLEPLDHDDALRLLTRLAGRPRVAADPAAATAVIEACGRFPLALRIAAERLASRPSWPIAYLAHRLADQHTRLDELVAGNLGVRASIALSYQTLPLAAQRVFRLLALTGAADFAAWVGDVVAGEPVTDIIDTLTDHSLLTAAGIDALEQPRYRFHDLVREYATELLVDDPETETARERLMRAWIELSDTADAAIPRGLYAPPLARPAIQARVAPVSAVRLAATDAKAWFAAEKSNLLATIEAAGATGACRLARELALRLAAFLHLNGYHDDAEHMWTTIADAADRAADTAIAARARLRAAIVIAADRGDPANAMPLLESCIAVFEEARDHKRLARAYGLRAYCCALTQGRIEQARTDAEHGLAHARQAGEPPAEFFCLRVLGVTLTRLGHHHDGITYCGQGLALARRLNDTGYTCVGLYALAQARLLAGQPDAVIDLCRQGLDLSTAPEHEPLRAYFHQQAGFAYQALDLHLAAIDELTAAAAQFQAHHDHFHQATTLRARSASHQATGHDHRAIRDLSKSAVLYRDLGRPDLENEIRIQLADRK